MRLLYLYANDGKFLSDLEVNFSKHFHFSISKKGGELHLSCRIDDEHKELPDKFFSIDRNNCMCSTKVSDVSVVAGGNGAGKTTVARLLQDLLNGGRPGCDIIAAYLLESDGREKLFAKAAFNYDVVYEADGQQHSKRLVTEKVPEDIGWNWVDDGVANAILNDFEMVYYSPSISLGTALEDTTDVVSNLSVGARFFKNSERYFNTLFAAQDAYLQSAGYVAEEMRNLLEFIKDFYSLTPAVRNGFPMPVPQNVIVTYNHAVERLLRIYFASDKIPEQLRKRCETALSLIDAKDMFCSAFVLYVLNYCRDLDVSNKEHNQVFGAHAGELLDFCQKLERRKNECKGKERRSEIICFLKQSVATVSQTVRSESEAAAELFALLDEAISELSDERELWKGYLELPIVRRGVRGDVAEEKLYYSSAFGTDVDAAQRTMQIVKLHRAAVLITDFLTFDITPRMSSGETAYLCMLAGFNWWANRKRKDSPLRDYAPSMDEFEKRMRRDVLVFLDEAETSLHPELQAQLLWVLIWFFENMTKGLSAHLVFASHSPILLSDVPFSNVVFLSRQGEGASAKLRVSDSLERDGVAMNNTFAAHIFDLYSIPFYLSRGTIGRFAAEKIAAIDKSLRNCKDFGLDKDRILMVVDMVGDDFIRNYLKRLCEEHEMVTPEDRGRW